MEPQTRRTFLLGSAAAAACLTACRREATSGKIEVNATEDLMQEHGVLERLLLVYEEGSRRLVAERTVPPEILSPAAALIRRFIEDYHEHNEEERIFPRARADRDLAPLVAVLLEQHQAGRRLTDQIEQLGAAGIEKDESRRQRLVETIAAFIRMYRPHAAREDTVLFPAMHRLLTPREFDEIGESFEASEQRHLGKEGFSSVVNEVARLERALGIDDLARFTPR